MAMEIYIVLGLIMNFIFIACVSSRITNMNQIIRDNAHADQSARQEMSHSFRERCTSIEHRLSETRQECIDYKYDIMAIKSKLETLPACLWKQEKPQC